MAVIILVHLARGQIAYWKDTVTLFRHALVLEPDNNLAHLDLGIGLAKQGRTAEAMREVREALRLNGDIAEAYLTLGSFLSKEGRFGEAIHKLSRRTCPPSKRCKGPFVSWHSPPRATLA